MKAVVARQAVAVVEVVAAILLLRQGVDCQVAEEERRTSAGGEGRQTTAAAAGAAAGRQTLIFSTSNRRFVCTAGIAPSSYSTYVIPQCRLLPAFFKKSIDLNSFLLVLPHNDNDYEHNLTDHQQDNSTITTRMHSNQFFSHNSVVCCPPRSY